MIDPRLLPEGFLEAYRRELGGNPPAEFLEAYDALCDALYFGTGLRPPRERTTGGDPYQYWFGEDALLGPKAAVDRRVAKVRSELRRWAAARTRQVASRSAPEAARRGVLARDGGLRGRGPVNEEKGT